MRPSLRNARFPDKMADARVDKAADRDSGIWRINRQTEKTWELNCLINYHPNVFGELSYLN